MQEATENLYSIQFVSNVTGINPHTIRAWEKRYGATTPVRDKNGRRLYSDLEIQRLDVLQKLVSYGNSISDIAKLKKNELEKVLEKYSLQESKELELSSPRLNINETLQNIYMSINFFKLDVLGHELQKAANALSAIDFALEIVNPLISEIRKLKGEGKMESEKREQIYLIIKSHLTKKIYTINYTSAKRRKVLVASAPGQLNELGAMVAAVIFLNKQFEVEYLGGNVRANILGKLSQQFKSEYIFVGLNYSHDMTMPLAEKEKYLEELGLCFYENTEVLVGAYDYCFQLPSENMLCFNDFRNLISHVAKK
ncbi:MAG: hypothetical protein CME66_13665 [Halobacteriovoraceae bacterium]|mgnify:CR=1 FL=1|nr:hypothetical protein [Halobacteriovoraceae bacterium]|tara:strand:+ start:279 stop:1211 length:933 start_codon:yes stop_codon:yes gene_type:complete